jgi:CheY-like chemotaxis protein
LLRQRLLLIDQHTRRREIHQRWLERAGAEVTVAERCDGAMSMLHSALVEDRPFGAAIIDGQSYGEDGWLLVEAMRQDASFDGCDVYLLMPAAATPQADRCMALHNVQALPKPVFCDQLVEAIHSCRACRETDSSPPPVALQPTPPLRILLAEDGEINQLVAVGLLEREGHQVLVVDNGRDAVHTWQGQSFDVILMDVEMPEMDGLEATHQIRQQEQATGQHIPIVAMTAHATNSFEERCRQLGMDEFLTKPIQPRRLFEVLRNIAQQRRATATR